MLRRLLRDMLLLAMRLDRLLGGVLDGPVLDPALRRHVADGPEPDAVDLVRQADDLRYAAAAAGLSPRRERHVVAQLDALRCTARTAAGAVVGFGEQVESYYGVRIRQEDPERYREVHRELDGLLPGRGSLADRLAAHRDRDRIPVARLGAALTAMSDRLREPTATCFGLPQHESVEWEVVHGRPWTAFTRHRGDGRSVVSVDASSGLRRGRLLPLVAHEAYPGHHTQYCRAATAAATLPELGMRLVHSPQGLLAEGAAESAHHVLPGPGWGRVAEDVLAGLGVGMDGEHAEALEAALDGLGRVRQDAALMRHVDGAGPDEVLAHLTRWTLVDERYARRMLAFLDHPRWRTYGTTYAEGRPLVAAWLARPGVDPVEALRRLLDEPWTPEDLLRETAPDRFRPLAD